MSIIVKSRRIDRYNTIKRICCIEIPTPTEVRTNYSHRQFPFLSSGLIQIVLRSTIADDDILPGVALNIARDINFKLGGQIRPLNINIVIFHRSTKIEIKHVYLLAQCDDHEFSNMDICQC